MYHYATVAIFCMSDNCSVIHCLSGLFLWLCDPYETTFATLVSLGTGEKAVRHAAAWQL